MPVFTHLRDLHFQIFEVNSLVQLLEHPDFAHLDHGGCTAMLDAALRVAEDKFLPHAAKADAEEPHFDGSRVHQPAEVKTALDAYIASGFLSAGFRFEWGGLQLPTLMTSAIGSIFWAANIGSTAYVWLTIAAANLIRAHGSEAQQQRYLLPMLAGRFFGTMCLSEPQAGSSLGDIKTRATRRADGLYQISGNKMWISGGEHELSENIVHLVLAKIDGGPPGVKGISLFIVPKKRLNADGSLGASNGITLMGLNHKMGYRATTNCALAFGDDQECLGELVGEPHKGLSYMFHMMNEARIGVGLGAVALGTAGYRYALDYCKTRSQGRPLHNKDPNAAPVAIIDHPDVRRMLLAQKAYVEGGLGLGMYAARLVDQEHIAPTPAAQAEISALLGLLTPIVKAWPSDWCLKANDLAIQCLGGYGYTRDYPLERLYRDNRLNPIHEGTNGIQGLDLLGRKVLGDNGSALTILAARMQSTIATTAANPSLQQFSAELSAALAQTLAATKAAGIAVGNGQIEIVLAHASNYLDALGHLVVAWQWLIQAQVANAALPQALGDNQRFYQGKLAACRYFFAYELPKVSAQLATLHSLNPLYLELDPEVL